MGNCCNGAHNDNDLLNSPKINNLEKPKNKKIYENNNQININNNTGAGIIKKNNIQKESIESNINEQHKSIKIPRDNDKYEKDILNISKIKLKMIIKQSKCLQEGKELIINSLGLMNTDKNNNNMNYSDGIVIFGDKNVSIFIFKI